MPVSFFDKVPLGLCRLWSKDLLSGLQQLHSNSVVHRDLKPGNLLLQMDPESGIMGLKLADFGASRLLTSPSPSSHEAALTQTRCTVMYSAPEMRTGRYGFPVDMWSAGAVVGEMLLGNIVFCCAGDDLKSLTAKICERLGSPTGDGLAGMDEVLRAALPGKKRSLGNLFSDQRLSRRPLSQVKKAQPLVENLLRWDPKSRLTASSAVAHSWLTGPVPTRADGLAAAKRHEGTSASADKEIGTAQGGEVAVCADIAQGAMVAGGAEGGAAATAQGAKLAVGGGPTAGVMLAERAGRTPAIARGGELAAGGTEPTASSHAVELVKCACTGHCMQPGHRYYKGCSTMVPKHGRKTFCDACRCFVVGCVRSRNDSEACHAHKRVVESWGPALQNVWHFRSLAPAMIPCDFAVLGKIWETVRDCSVLQTLVFLIQEPTVVAQVAHLGQQLPRPFNAEELLGVVLRPLAEFMDGRVARKEHENLNGQGVEHAFSVLGAGQNRGQVSAVRAQCGMTQVYPASLAS